MRERPKKTNFTYLELETYLLCPKRYRYTRIHKPAFIPVQEAFESTLHGIIDRVIYSGISSDYVKPLRSFSKEWRDRWKARRESGKLQGCNHSSYLSLLKRGERYIRNFYIRFRDLCATDTHPQGVVHNFYYSLVIPGGYKLKGKMDLVYPDKKGAVIVKLMMEDKSNLAFHAEEPTIHAKLDRELMIWALGFRSTLNHKPYALKYFYLCDGTEITKIPQTREYLRVRRYLGKLCKTTHEPKERHVGYHCFNCPYQLPCIQEEEDPNGIIRSRSSVPDIQVEQQDPV